VVALGAGVLLIAPFIGFAQDKVTICHFTGSDSNPFVEITVSVNSLPAHIAHGDVVAPADGCSSLGGGVGGGQV